MLAFVSTFPAFAADDGKAPAVEQSPRPPSAPGPAAEPPERGVRLEFRAGAEVLPALGIGGWRDYTLEVNGAAYGGTAAGLANLIGPLWVGLGFSYDVVNDDGTTYSETGPISGYLMHLPLLVEVGFRVAENGSRVIVGLEFGRAWGGFENIFYSFTDEATTRISGAFLGLRGGYALALGRHFAAVGFLGVRVGSLDQTNATIEGNDGLFYRAVAAHLAVAFSP
jgi:hypothetical protein